MSRTFSLFYLNTNYIKVSKYFIFAMGFYPELMILKNFKEF